MSNGPSITEIEEARRVEAFLKSPMAIYLQETFKVEPGDTRTPVFFSHRHYPHTLYVNMVATSCGWSPMSYTLIRIEDLRGHVEQVKKSIDLTDIDPWVFLPEICGSRGYLLGRKNGYVQDEPISGTDEEGARKYPVDPFEQFLDKMTVVTAQPPHVLHRVPNANKSEENPDPYIFETIYSPEEGVTQTQETSAVA